MSVPPDGTDDGGHEALGQRISRVAARAAAAAATFDPPADPPAPDRARTFLRDGVGTVLRIYIDARTGPTATRFSASEYERLEDALNTWLRLYAACYGVDMEPNLQVRTVAEALLDTNDLVTVAHTLLAVGPPAADEPL